jgi:acetyl esterase/lipase
MRSFHLIQPDLNEALESLRSFELVQERLGDLKRQMAAAVPALSELKFDQVSVDKVLLRGRSGNEIAIYLFRPNIVADGQLPLYFHMHGGGYVLGHPLLNASECARICASLGCIVASVDYRLAPDANALEQVYDCFDALAATLTLRDGPSVDCTRVVLGGESAGAGLAAALAILVRDENLCAPCLQLLAAPMLDDRTGSDAGSNSFLGEFVWTPEANRIGWNARFEGLNAEQRAACYAAPSRLKDPSGLCPAYIDVGAMDLFLPECLDYAGRLAAAGIPVECHVYPGAFHGFEFAALATASQMAMANRDAALRSAFSRR